MTHIRISEAIGPFISGSRGICLRETEDAVWMKGRQMVGPLSPASPEVVFGPIPKKLVFEYHPGPPERTLKEIVGEFWERRGQ